MDGLIYQNDIMKLILLKLQPIELLSVLTIKKDLNFDLDRYFWEKYVESEWGVPRIMMIRFKIFDLHNDKKLFWFRCGECGKSMVKYKRIHDERCSKYDFVQSLTNSLYF